MLIYTGLPEVTVKPFNQTVEVTYTAIFIANVKGIGVENFRYVWIHDGKTLRNENSPMLIIHKVKYADRGKYQCRISNIYNDKGISGEVVLRVTST